MSGIEELLKCESSIAECLMANCCALRGSDALCGSDPLTLPFGSGFSGVLPISSSPEAQGEKNFEGRADFHVVRSCVSDCTSQSTSHHALTWHKNRSSSAWHNRPKWRPVKQNVDSHMSVETIHVPEQTVRVLDQNSENEQGQCKDLHTTYRAQITQHLGSMLMA